MPVQGTMEKFAGVEGEEDVDVEGVAVEGDKVLVPCLQTILRNTQMAGGRGGMAHPGIGYPPPVGGFNGQVAKPPTPPPFQHCEDVCKLECLFFVWI
jgi:hypothetical protein